MANQSQFLLLTMSSLRHLAQELISNKLLPAMHMPELPPNSILYPNKDISEHILNNHGDEVSDNKITRGQKASIEVQSFIFRILPTFKILRTFLNYDKLQATVIDCLIGRFRGNLVIDGSDKDAAYEEETWNRIQIGTADFEVKINARQIDFDVLYFY